jgi:branched-chain amino acid transport system permease protein
VLLLQLLINGVALGSAYALVALGFVLILNATSAVNFAQGDLVMVGGFVAILAATLLPVPGIVLLPVVMIFMAIFGLVFSTFAYFPLKSRPPVSVFISTIALATRSSSARLRSASSFRTARMPFSAPNHRSRRPC